MNTRHCTKWIALCALVMVIAAATYGVFQYALLRKENRSLLLTNSTLRKSIESLKDNLSLTEYERDKLSTVLEITKEKTGELEKTTEKLNATVSEYEKLHSLDPELLKKYSKVYFLNEHYIPSGLTAIDEQYVNGENRALQLHERVWPYMERLLHAADKEGLGLLITSAYRSFGTQAALKASYRVIYGAGTANQFSADQGYSEHQLGTTVDFTTKKMRTLGGSFDQTPESKWLTDHAHEYGFVLSYPKGNKYYIYEPWHWRFVGVELATMLHEEKKTLYELEQRTIDEYLIGIFD